MPNKIKSSSARCQDELYTSYFLGDSHYTNSIRLSSYKDNLSDDNVNQFLPSNGFRLKDLLERHSYLSRKALEIRYQYEVVKMPSQLYKNLSRYHPGINLVYPIKRLQVNHVFCILKGFVRLKFTCFNKAIINGYQVKHKLFIFSIIQLIMLLMRLSYLDQKLTSEINYGNTGLILCH